MDSGQRLLGLAKKAGRLEIGEEPVGVACRTGRARLILLAADAADNTLRRAEHFAQLARAPWVQSPWSKTELGGTVGRSSCAMLAFTDVGLAAAVAGKLAQADPARYGGAAAALEEKAARNLERQKEQRRHEKKLARAKPWAAPSAGQVPAKEEKGKGTRNGYKHAGGGRRVT